MNENIEIPTKDKRNFLPQELKINSWDNLLPYFVELENSVITDVADLKVWLANKSELEAVLEEDLAWRYIKMSIDTRDKKAAQSFHFFIEEIEPKIAPFQNKFNLKLQAFSAANDLNDEALKIIVKKATSHVSTFSEKNIPLQTKLQSKSQEFGAISAEMSIQWQGKKLTLQQASVLLKDNDREVRESVYHLIQNRRLADKDKLNDLFNELIELRHQLALNSNYENFRDYKFVDMCRFDYTAEDCKDFHRAVADEVLPLIQSFDEDRRKKLKLDKLKPWDGQVDLTGKPALKPFNDAKDLINKSIECFDQIDPYFGECIQIMSEMGHLDLDSKEGKAPGGFNYPLYEIGVPFIYMNSAGTVRDMVTMMHEGGHAVHSFLSRNLPYTDYKDLTSEVAELASMSMELMSMEHWDVFFSDKDELKRAKKEQLEQTIDTLPWVAQIDKFQHWIYENPSHSNQDREEAWDRLMTEFNSPVIDWENLNVERKYLWQKQLHLYEVPFYYIEYGMAQLGAIAIWKNYKENPTKTVQQFKNALSLGYTKSIGDIYEEAGISFNFNQSYVQELMFFMKNELQKLD